ncbi:MAG: putative CtpA-like serine protease [Deltaproteobacteria bacterium ADurb.Bin151]|nr:MAG: putative CtpA-like serine protease [Deltaproteobacteria bacterium ADurb.Bin151]HNZ09948.1 S41 family peptidase [Smithellaceae bacterium]HQP23940.1 S41 family peptidase [Smithellaceae bacterium]
MKNISVKGLVFAIVIIGFFVVFWTSSDSLVSAKEKNIYKEIKTFNEVLDMVQKNYVDQVDSSSLIQGAINGMIKTLDPHSSFMTPDVYKGLEEETQGHFGGIGIEITLVKDVLTVVSPIEDTPAYKAGVKAGDQIIKIDGKTTKDISMMEAVKKLRGKKGTKVTITITREGMIKPKNIILTRAEIQVQSVKAKTFDHNIGYIRISSFNEKTAADLRKALADVKVKSDPMQGLVLDLRNDPGGLLNQAIEVSDMFLRSGVIVSTRGRTKSMETRMQAKDDGAREVTVPMVVLVNEGTASAAEIVAGALQDNGRALIAGTQTFGKASVQTVIRLEDGSALKLTTARYYTPKGRSIQAEGIKPDLIVKLKKPSQDTTDSQPDEMMREKDLEGHILPAGEEDRETEDRKTDSSKEMDDLEKDNQVRTAVDILRGWHMMKKNLAN